MMKCTGIAEPKLNLVEMGWPTGEVDPLYLSMFSYLTHVKSEIRVVHAKAKEGPKKKGKGKAPVEATPAVELATCCMFTGNEFPAYKKQVLELLQDLEFDFDNKGKPSAAMKKQLAPAV